MKVISFSVFDDISIVKYNNWLIFESSIIHSLEWDVWMKNARAVIQDICGLQNFVAFGTMLFS